MLYSIFGLSMAICMLVTSAVVISTEKNMMTYAFSVILSLLALLHPTWWMVTVAAYFCYAALISSGTPTPGATTPQKIFNSITGERINGLKKIPWLVAIWNVTFVTVVTGVLYITPEHRNETFGIIYGIIIPLFCASIYSAINATVAECLKITATVAECLKDKMIPRI